MVKPVRKKQKTNTGVAKKPRVKKPVPEPELNAPKGKPEPTAPPQVCADKRQQLCETLDWYRGYQASAYCRNGVVFGVMSDAGCGPRDIIDDEIIISAMYDLLLMT